MTSLFAVTVPELDPAKREIDLGLREIVLPHQGVEAKSTLFEIRLERRGSGSDLDLEKTSEMAGYQLSCEARFEQAGMMGDLAGRGRVSPLAQLSSRCRPARRRPSPLNPHERSTDRLEVFATEERQHRRVVMVGVMNAISIAVPDVKDSLVELFHEQWLKQDQPPISVLAAFPSGPADAIREVGAGSSALSQTESSCPHVSRGLTDRLPDAPELSVQENLSQVVDGDQSHALLRFRVALDE
ncbi:MAG: hypothetical protein WBD40_09565 [Tepidisphaeraceae bacterium]